VAGRYQQQQHLIGPSLFPIYLYVLRQGMLWAAAIYTVVAGVQIAFAEPGSSVIMESVLRVPGILLQVAAWITATFAAFEYAGSRGLITFPGAAYMKPDWSPSSLPPLEREESRKGRSYPKAVAEAIFGFLALLWLLLIPNHPYLLFGPSVYYIDALPYQLAPVWTQFYYWIVALNVLQVGWRFVDLMRGTWERPQRVQGLLFKAVGMVPLFLVLTVKDQALVMLKNPADFARYGSALGDINRGVHTAFLIIALIASIQLVVDVFKLGMEVWRKRAA